MKYRKFGRLDWQVSALAFGLERLPPDEAESIKMLRYAINRGVNLVDAGSPLAFKANQRLSRLLHEALKDGYRQKIKIAVTMPSFKINATRDFDHYLDELLKWLHEDSVDFLLLGGLNRDSWPKLEELDAVGWA